MKHLIIALCFMMSTPAFADKFVLNEEGGMIVLLKEPCDQPVSSKDFAFYSYATEASGRMHHGCWKITDTPPDAGIPMGVSVDFSHDISEEDGVPVTVVLTLPMHRFSDLLIGGLPDATQEASYVDPSSVAEELPPLLEADAEQSEEVTVAGLTPQVDER